jgi:hypothetical protein
MKCENQVSYHVPSGYHYREVFTPCGMTDVYGEEAQCDTCHADPRRRADLEHREALSREDNATARACGWGEY